MKIDQAYANDYEELEGKRETLSNFFNEIDENVACTTRCPECDKWMHYEGFISYDVDKYSGKRLYAFTVCDECKIAWSF